jgi:hypothetical protein
MHQLYGRVPDDRAERQFASYTQVQIRDHGEDTDRRTAKLEESIARSDVSSPEDVRQPARVQETDTSSYRLPRTRRVKIAAPFGRAAQVHPST